MEGTNSPSTYIGVRKRKWGKWVSEIRQPGKKTRIWLGSFESPEMAAVAHDVAALWFKGDEARLNFPDSINQLPTPLSSDPNHIRSAALEAALQVKLQQKSVSVSVFPTSTLEQMGSDWGFGLDEWELDSHKMWTELAEAMLLAPPQLWSCCEMNSCEVEHLEQASLWDPL